MLESNVSWICVQNFKSIASTMAEIWHKTCQNRHFSRHFGTLPWFSEFVFLTDFAASKSVLGSFSRILRKSDLKTCIAALNHDFFFCLTFFTRWPEMTLTCIMATKHKKWYFKMSVTLSMPIHWLCFLLKISVTEVYCSAMFIIQWNLHSSLSFLLNLVGTYAHIRQVGRAALPVIVPNKATAELEYGADVTAPTLTGPVPGRYGQYTPWQYIPAHFPSAAGQLGYDWAELLWTEANFKWLQAKQKSEFRWQTPWIP